ncbi:hypothetical protein TSUD_74470 [Trifolium subterraneum]|nr:hypothetical protein TSUD_74470 [Trifolium subterraneum]
MNDDNNGRKREQVQTLNQKQNNKKPKQVFPYGNYKSYYNYRIGDGADGDPRLKVFRKEWFEGKDCLDIGCNSGLVTIQIALKFNCRSILGVDIDSDRVEDANWNLRKTARLNKSAANKPSKVSKLKDNSHTDHSENSATVSSDGGIFVLEPQPWKSYESNRAASETTAANFRNIKFRPQEFQEILLDKIGFRTVEAITSDLTGSTTGFNRPILIFQK